MALLQKTIQQISIVFAQHVKLKKNFVFFSLQKKTSKCSSSRLPCSIDNLEKKLHENFGKNSLKCRKSEKNIYSEKIWIFFQMFSWTRSVQFRHSCWSTLAIYQKFLSSNSEKVKEYFSYKLFSKDSSGHIKCSFEYPAKSFLTKPEQYLWKFRKLWKLPWTVLSDTWNTVVVFHQENSQKIWKKIAQFPELIDNFFPENISPECSFGHVDGSSDTLAETIEPVQTASAQHLIVLNEIHFSNTKFILKMLLKTATLQHLQPCQKITRKFWEKITEIPKMRDKQNFREKSFH